MPSIVVLSARARSRSSQLGLLFCGALLALSVTFASTAWAEHGSGRPDGNQTVVSVFVVGDQARYEEFQRALSTQLLTRRGLSVGRVQAFDPRAFIERPTRREPKLSCWVDLSRARLALLYFKNQNSDRFLIRKLPISSEFGEVDRESVAQALELSLNLLAEDEAAGVTREQARSLLEDGNPESEAPVPEPQPAKSPSAPAAEPRSRVRGPTEPRAPTGEPSAIGYGQVFYASRLHSEAFGLTGGPGLGAGYLSPAGGWLLGPSASGWYELNDSFQSELIGLEISGANLRLALEALQGLAGGTSAAVRVGVGLDFTRLRPRASEPEAATPTEARTSHAWVTSLSLLGRARIFETLSAFMSLGLEFDPAKVHYDVLIVDLPTQVVTRHRLRPVASLGLEL